MDICGHCLHQFVTTNLVKIKLLEHEEKEKEKKNLEVIINAICKFSSFSFQVLMSGTVL